jgi:hypothetical protein
MGNSLPFTGVLLTRVDPLDTLIAVLSILLVLSLATEKLTQFVKLNITRLQSEYSAIPQHAPQQLKEQIRKRRERLIHA